MSTSNPNQKQRNFGATHTHTQTQEALLQLWMEENRVRPGDLVQFPDAQQTLGEIGLARAECLWKAPERCKILVLDM